MKAVAASLLTAAVLVGGAWATNSTPSHVAALEQRVAALEASDQRLTNYLLSCLHGFRPVTEYGSSTDGSNGAGYVFRDGSSGDESLTQALDFSDKAADADGWVAFSKHDCSKMKP